MTNITGSIYSEDTSQHGRNVTIVKSAILTCKLEKNLSYRKNNLELLLF